MTEGKPPLLAASASGKGEALAAVLHDVNTVIVCLNIWEGYLPQNIQNVLVKNLEKVVRLIESL